MSYLKKLDPESGRLLAALKERANKKAVGRKIRDSEILSLGLRLIEPNHILGLQDKSLTEKDRLQIAHSEYQKENGKISLDQFIGLLIRGEFSKKVPL